MQKAETLENLEPLDLKELYQDTHSSVDKAIKHPETIKDAKGNIKYQWKTISV